MSDLLITNVDVLTNEGVLKNHAIEIENGFITSIVKNSEVEKAKESAKDVLDGKGQLLFGQLRQSLTMNMYGMAHNLASLKCCVLVQQPLAICISS